MWKGKNGPLLIAEIGGNHEGNFEYAKELTQLACESGVDVVKFQVYTGNSLVNKLVDPDRNQHFKKFELKKNQYIDLYRICLSEDVIFTASVWDISAFDWIDNYVPFYKIGSGDLTALPIIDKITQYRKPILLSTGLATLEEIRRTIDYIQKKDSIYKDPAFFALLQCTSMYPIPKSDANLNVILKLKRSFNLPVGYSDHTIGSLAIETAVSMGAEIIEFHFTDKREGKTFRDHKVSLTQKEVKHLIEKIKNINILKGEEIKKPLASEINSGHVKSFRRAFYLKKDIPKGSIIKHEDLTVLRPNVGVDARESCKIVGKRTKHLIKAYEPISLEDLY